MGFLDRIVGRNPLSKRSDEEGLILPPRDEDGRYIRYKDPEKHKAEALKQKKARREAREKYFESVRNEKRG